MAKEVPSTSQHKGPIKPETGRKRAALICAFPEAQAFGLPDSGTVIGRNWLVEHGIVDTEVSSAHVRIDRAGGVLRIADVGSRNGTWVNGARLSPRDLTPVDDGAVIRMGRSLFVYREELSGPFLPAPPFHGLVGPYGLRGVAMQITGLSRGRPNNVLIEGETGVGKELVARAISETLGRSTPYAAINVAGVAKGLFESQMFGHVAGAFSDAKVASAGVVMAHVGGTLFLDEIGELDLELQTKLLRLLENREVLPVGAQKPLKADILVVAATNRDLEAMVEQGAFRRDLFARLAMARVKVPPLRDRCEDIFSIAAELALREGSNLPPETVEVEVMERLLIMGFPGNIRELSASLAAIRRIDPNPGLRLWALVEALGEVGSQKTALTEEMMEKAIAKNGGNVTAAAAQLGVSRGKSLRFRKQSPR